MNFSKIEASIRNAFETLYVDADAERKAADRKVMEGILALRGVEWTTLKSAKERTALSYVVGYNASTKVEKGTKKSYDTAIMYLAPAMNSGINMCPTATEGCKKACLFTAGRARTYFTAHKRPISDVNWARLRRTWLFKVNPSFYKKWMELDIQRAKGTSQRKGHTLTVRLNGTSDIKIGVFGQILNKFSDIQFYDYTKVWSQLDNTEKFKNYAVAWSFANSNEFGNFANTYKALELGYRASVCFDLDSFGGEFPKTFMGKEVVNGDETDLIFLTPENCILGLNFKKNGSDKTENRFIVTKEIYNQIHS